MTISLGLRRLLNKGYCGVMVTRREEAQFGLRVYPYCEVHSDRDRLASLQAELLNISVTSSLRPNFLRIQGIQNCRILTGFLNKEGREWWFKAVGLFVNVEHLKKKGILKIVKMRPPVKNKSLRIKNQVVVQTLMESR